MDPKKERFPSIFRRKEVVRRPPTERIGNEDFLGIRNHEGSDLYVNEGALSV